VANHHQEIVVDQEWMFLIDTINNENDWNSNKVKELVFLFFLFFFFFWRVEKSS
jgi:hypothetical protein